MVNCTVDTIFDGVPELIKALKELQENEVLVGIPEAKSSRKKEIIRNSELLYIHTHGIRRKSMRQEMQETMDSGSPYSEAYQLYIQEHGSPLWASPPRPVLEPAIEHRKDWIAEQLSKAAEAALDGNVKGVQDGLHKAGQVAENAARDWFTDPTNGWAPNSPETIKLKGSDKPLINTDQMRKSITHVLRRKGVSGND
jgi:hypothetical protein